MNVITNYHGYHNHSLYWGYDTDDDDDDDEEGKTAQHAKQGIHLHPQCILKVNRADEIGSFISMQLPQTDQGSSSTPVKTSQHVKTKVETIVGTPKDCVGCWVRFSNSVV